MSPVFCQSCVTGQSGADGLAVSLVASAVAARWWKGSTVDLNPSGLSDPHRAPLSATLSDLAPDADEMCRHLETCRHISRQR